MPRRLAHGLFPIAVLAAIAAAPEATSGSDWADHPENRWVKQSPREGSPAPSFGWEGSGSYDPGGRQWIHFGGHDGIPQGFHLFTYELDSGRWRQRFPNTSPPGVCCVDGANVFDVANHRFVRFPGASLGHGYQWSRGVKLKGSHVWLYDPAANGWTNMRPPPYAGYGPREGLGQLDAGATYDANREVAISFGGQASAGGMNNLFVYDAYANRLERLAAARPPEPRDGMGLAYDAKNDCLVMFGSQYSSDEATWIYRYDTNRWEAHALDPHPPGEKLGTYSTIPKMAYDSRNGICLCVVWDTNTNEHQTWAFDAAALRWTKLNPPVEPEASMSRSRNLSYSAADNVFILETSSKAGKGRSPQIWTFRSKTAPADVRPAPPTNLQVVTDAKRAKLTWTAPKSAREYHVYRAEAADAWKAKFAKVAAIGGTDWEDNDVTPGTVYFYKVRAIGAEGGASHLSFQARTQPRVMAAPVVSVLAPDKVAVTWQRHTATDVIGYNLYRGVAAMRTVKQGTPAPWRDNDPEYAQPTPVEVKDIQELRRLNGQPIASTSFTDRAIDLRKPSPAADEYRFHVYAYCLKAVNRLGVESGPSPYALTIPSEPTHVLSRERGETAELKWTANPEQGIAGYHVYKLEGTWNIRRVTEGPIKETAFTHQAGKNTTRYWIVAVDALGQEGQPSSPVWHQQSYRRFFEGEWHP
jgi:hypothetical protein